MLDQTKAGFAAAAIDEEAANIAIALSARKGYLDGRSLAEVFAWLRPTDLVWRYWVNNYVEGRSPAAFDVLYWNADTTRMAAALHRDRRARQLARHVRPERHPHGRPRNAAMR